MTCNPLFLLDILGACSTGASAAFDAGVTVVCASGAANRRAAGGRGTRVAGDAARTGLAVTLVRTADGRPTVDGAGASATSNAGASAWRAASTADVAVAGGRSGCAAGDAAGAGPTLAIYFDKKSAGNYTP